ncbi:MAG TPA: PQQ-binding-like beta-propeller repeat protein [Candidatus Bathyarchaeia archaeon]|nr:PQQ-binding-like beta-propeller repeat protein [Candidatus Bathyarchaeia archaeon]
MTQNTVLVASCVVVAMMAQTVMGADWPQWLGPERNGISSEVPQKLPEKKVLWRRPMSGESHGGIAVAAGRVVVPDLGEGKEIIRCFGAERGEAVWSHSYPAAGEIEFGSSMRTTPLIHAGKVFTLGAGGELTCLELATANEDKTAKVVWRMNIAETCKATRPHWGYSASPLIADGLLIVAPGAADAAVVALDPATGKEKWRAVGESAAYASFIVAKLGGVTQLVGYDKESLGGWDLKNGQRLWSVKPENDGDFNVGTPVVVGERLLVSTENNGTRLFQFGKDGVADPKPVAKNDDLSLDMGTPVLWKGRAYATRGGLYCINADDAMKTAWSDEKEDGFSAYSACIAGNDRLMVFGESGTLCLVDISGKEGQLLGKMTLCEKTWSYPALADGRLYIRDAKWLYAYEMK